MRNILTLAIVSLFLTGALSTSPGGAVEPPATTAGLPLPDEDPLEGRVQWIVGYDRALPDGFDRLLALHHGELFRVDTALRFAVITLPETRVDAFLGMLRSFPEITYAKPDGALELFFTPDDTRYGDQWGPQTIGMETAWDTTRGGHDVTVAVVDTGVAYDHPDLAPNVCVIGPDFGQDDDDPYDTYGHGTHVAGTVAAVIDNGLGVAGMSNACIMAVKIEAHGGLTWSAAASALQWSADNGADIIQMSWGSYSDPGAPLSTAVRYAHDAGVLLIASAGNAGCGEDTVGFPAAYPEVVATAALEAPGHDRAGFSSCGPAVELSAPGADILSTVPTSIDPSGYRSASGTSMASPHVSGAAALYWSENRGQDAATVRCVLAQKTLDLGGAGKDPSFGFGRIQVPAMLTDPTCLPMPPLPTRLHGLSGDGTAALGWRPAFGWGGVDGYLVYRNDTSGGWTEIANVTTTTYEDTDVVRDTTYRYAVAAYNEAGRGNKSEPLSLTVVAAKTLPLREGFEDGLGGWNATGLWGITSDRSGNGTESAYFGIEGEEGPQDNHYVTGESEYGTLTSPPIRIPADTTASLRFWQYAEIDLFWVDHPIIEVATSDDPFRFVPVWWMDNPETYEGPGAVDLSAFAGQVVHVRFVGDVDPWWSGDEGWYIDEVAVVTEAAPAIDPVVRLTWPSPDHHAPGEGQMAGSYFDPNGDADVADVALRVDDRDWVEPTFRWGNSFHGPYDNVTTGAHLFAVRATDAAGRNATHAATAQVDADPPSLTVTAPTDGALFDQCVFHMAGSASDTGGSGLWVLVYYFEDPDGGAVVGQGRPLGGNASSWSFNASWYPEMASGSYLLHIGVYDGAGNAAWTNLTVTREGRMCRPEIEVVGPTEGETVGDRVTIHGNVDWLEENATGTLWVYAGGDLVGRFDGLAEGPWSTTWNSWRTMNGTHTILVRAYEPDRDAWNDTRLSVVVENERDPRVETSAFDGRLGCSIALGPVTTADRCGDGAVVTDEVSPGLTAARIVLTWDPASDLERLGFTLGIGGRSWQATVDGPGRAVLELDGLDLGGSGYEDASIDVRAANGDGLLSVARDTPFHIDATWAYWDAPLP